MNGKHSLGSQWSLACFLILALTACTRVSQSQTAPPFTTLYTFNGTDGNQPYAGLVEDKAGNLYGTTFYGGPYGRGTVFKLTPNGKLTTLHSFQDFPIEGAYPLAALTWGKDGNLYGTTFSGGTSGFNGTVFQITPTGTLTTLHTFTGAEGAEPIAGVIQGTDGNFYGTTYLAGDHTNGGLVYQVTPSGALTILHAFTPGGSINDEGANPYGGVIQAKNGNLYGTTSTEGLLAAGTVFEVTTSGVFTLLDTLGEPSTPGAEIGGPEASLLEGKDGYLYGTAGSANGWGAIFRITLAGDLSVVGNFEDSYGSGPLGPLIYGNDGNFYGTTWGTTNSTATMSGTVYRFSVSGGITPIYTFTPLDANKHNSDGAYLYAGLLQGRDGNLYGTAQSGGAYGAGTVFKLTMVPAITSFNPVSGPPGTVVMLTGANFTTAKSVKVGTKSASFTINSDTSLTLTVPSGANNAKITVTNSFGPGASLTAFLVAPVISSFSPGKGPVGTTVTLKGVNFKGAMAVKLGSVSASFTINSDTSLTLIVPTGAVTAPISVSNAYGTGVSNRAFTVTP
jgi:uncharacterized repeat protein (TIGR03803 family)